jgi:hypothetical protein
MIYLRQRLRKTHGSVKGTQSSRTEVERSSAYRLVPGQGEAVPAGELSAASEGSTLHNHGPSVWLNKGLEMMACKSGKTCHIPPPIARLEGL